MALLTLTGGVAQASYINHGAFPIGSGAKGIAVDQSSGAFSGDAYIAQGFAFQLPNSEVSRFAVPLSPETSASATFDSGTRFSGVAVNPSNGNVYALDYEHGVVDEFDPSKPDTKSEEGETIPATPIATIGASTITLGDNTRIWVDSSGQVFVPDTTRGVVDVFDAAGKLTREIGAGVLHEPTAAAVDSSGNVYVVDSTPAAVEGEATPGRVQELSSTGAVEGVLGKGILSSAQGVTVNVATSEAIVIDDRETETQIDAFEASPESSPGVFTPGSLRLKSGPGELLQSGNLFGIGVDPSSGDVYLTTYGFIGGNMAPIFVPAEGPKATTLGSEAMSAAGATVNGGVNPNGFDTHWHFEYGLSQSYGQDSPLLPGTDAGSEATTQFVKSVLSGLQPDKVYHYQLVAENQNGTGEGGDRTFMTPAAPPSVVGQSSSEVMRTTATVKAQINPNNQDTHYFFQYGTDITYSLGNVPSAPGEDIGAAYGQQTHEAILSGLQPNTLYHDRVIAANATGTTEGVDHTFVTLPDAPSVTTGAASGVGQTTASLTGTIDPHGAETSYYFEILGPGTFSIVSGKAGSGNGNATVTVRVNGLSPGAPYKYRLIATNAGGTTVGSYQTFTTAPPPPSGPPAVVTGGTSNLTPTTATLTGTVDRNGGATSYQFQYGTSAVYGASLSEASAGSGAEAEDVAATLSGLVPGSTYHYRLLAINAASAGYGADQTFTTPAGPVSVFGPLPTNTILSSTTITRPKPLTRAQLLAKALKACKKDKSKAKRAKCEKEAHKKYGTKAKKKR